jgi:hypothetical protein
MNRSQCQLALLIPVVLVCFALSPIAQAVDPPPDGGYPNDNTAEGEDALFSLTTGYDNTAIGFNALYFDTIGWENTAVGWRSLYTNTTGFQNVALGNYSLFYNENGASNTSLGYSAMVGNTSGSQNTAVGYTALFVNRTGTGNVGIGLGALYGNFTGDTNVALGQQALYFLTSGSNNIAVGFLAGEQITGNDNIDIGHTGFGNESGVIRIGTERTHTATYIAGIRATPLVQGAAIAVGITADGQLGVRASSARFKEGIKPMDKASEAILALKPVTFHYKTDQSNTLQFGLIAEEVARVNPDLVAPDADGKPFTIRYDEVNAMLLNEFLKEHRKVEKLEATVAQQRRDFETALAQVKAEVQKVSTQLELSQVAAKTVVGNQ